jgi:membrane protein YqaA with SNARE-associated domain
MNFEELTAKIGIYAASFVVGFVSGLVPFINSELFLLAVSTLAKRPGLMQVALLTALGQMVAKTILFYAGRGVLKINMGKYQRKIEAVQEKFVRWENKTDALIFLSATVGFPPFYVVSFVAGALKLNVIKFFIAGFLGRGIRFAAIVYFPQFVMKYI